jgi:TPR repeat protein
LNQGYFVDQYNYNLRFENEEGVAKDLRLVAEYHKKAMDQGHANAKTVYGRVQKQLKGS